LGELSTEYRALDNAAATKAAKEYRKKRLFNDLNKTYVECVLTSCQVQYINIIKEMKSDVDKDIKDMKANKQLNKFQKEWLAYLMKRQKALAKIDLKKITFKDVVRISP